MHLNRQNRIIVSTYVLLTLAALTTSSMLFPLRNVSSLCFAVMSIVFIMSTGKRIINGTLRVLLVGTGIMLLLLFTLQIIKYSYIANNSMLQRFLNYAYHLPLLGLTLLSFYASLAIGHLRAEEALKKWMWLLLPFCALCLLFLTNDVHELAYGIDGSGKLSGYHPLYYISILWQLGFSLATLTVSFKKSRVLMAKKRVWLPIAFLVLGLLLFLLYYQNDGNSLRLSYFVLQFQSIYAITVVGFWESCIQVGLIPSNSDYEGVFNISSLNAQIADDAGNIVYRSSKATPLEAQALQDAESAPVLLDSNTRLSSKSIHGGHVYYTDDITAINTFNEELRDAAELIAEENIITEEENIIKQEKAHLEAQNKLYDLLSFELTPTLNEIQELIGRREFAKACVLGAYVKRRANLFILSQQQDTADIAELTLAIRESLSYLRLLGTEGAVFCDTQGAYGTKTLLDAYDRFERVLEENMDTLQSMMVVVTPDALNLSMDASALTLTYRKEGNGDA